MHRAFVFAAATALVSSVLGSPVARSCSSPYTRKEWRELSTTEQTQFITALKCLGELPHSTLVPTNYTAGIVSVNPSSSRYDDFVYAHMDTNVKDHFTGLFLPWHRWYLTAFEKELRTQCDYTGYLPYWDWSLDSGNVVASPVFSSSTTTGFGSFGVAPGYQVTDGAFATVQRAYPTPHVIARNFKAKPFEEQVFPFEFTTPDLLAADTFTPAKITEIVNGFSGDFIGFAAHMDGVRAQGMHNAAHLMTRPGDLSNPSHSPNDPLFFLHHANLDRIWDKWQLKSTANSAAYGGGSVQDLAAYDTYPVGAPPNVDTTWALPTSGLDSALTVSDVMSTTGGYLCFVYSEFTGSA
ncbi:Di-copper centre-containing protein [Rhizoctonia solani]|uniref:Di-copper centre-containing protein n=1 Tax=Rhizoctonia solani TaxID=456999 RepID=A0A8H7HE37_9AGAM|nr:Di-copper centre-containing protein [Rhizoctonia solani]